MGSGGEAWPDEGRHRRATKSTIQATWRKKVREGKSGETSLQRGDQMKNGPQTAGEKRRKVGPLGRDKTQGKTILVRILCFIHYIRPRITTKWYKFLPILSARVLLRALISFGILLRQQRSPLSFDYDRVPFPDALFSRIVSISSFLRPSSFPRTGVHARFVAYDIGDFDVSSVFFTTLVIPRHFRKSLSRPSFGVLLPAFVGVFRDTFFPFFLLLRDFSDVHRRVFYCRYKRHLPFSTAFIWIGFDVFSSTPILTIIGCALASPRLAFHSGMPLQGSLRAQCTQCAHVFSPLYVDYNSVRLEASMFIFCLQVRVRHVRMRHLRHLLGRRHLLPLSLECARDYRSSRRSFYAG